MMERALYNGINAGMSLGGNLYCYRNPLASTGEKLRNPWYDTLCCPPNLQRTFLSLGGAFYSTSREAGGLDALWLHFHDNHRLDWRLPSGIAIRTEMTTGMPWAGDARLSIMPEKAARFSLRIRIPEWSAATKVTVNGTAFTGAVRANTYLELDRTWKPGDVVTLAFDLTPRRITANPRVPETFGKVSVQRGPLLYCLEQEDVPGGASVFDVALAAGTIRPARRPGLFGGQITVLEAPGLALAKPASAGPLYTFDAPARPSRPLTLVLVPYFAFHNRGDQPFTTWLPVA